MCLPYPKISFKFMQMLHAITLAVCYTINVPQNIEIEKHSSHLFVPQRPLVAKTEEIRTFNKRALIPRGI